MKVTYTTPNGRMTVEFDVDTQSSLVQELNRFQEVFEETKCGKCGSENLRWVVRTVDDNQYYELRCMDCNAKLAFGSHKVGGGLFPKRKDGDDWLPDKGWMKWNPTTNQNE